MIDYKRDLGEEEKEILIDLTVQDKEYLKRQRIIQVCGGILSVAIFVLGILNKDIVFEVGGVILLLLDIFAVGPIQKKAIREAYGKIDQRVVSGGRHYVMDETGIKIKSPFGESENRWDAYIGHGEYGHYVWIQRADRQMILIDKSVLSEDQLLELKGYVDKI